MRRTEDIRAVRLIVGLEIHVELATRTKMFSRAGNPAHPSRHGAEPNTLIDPVVLGLPGALPVMNKSAVELAALVGMALGCSIPPSARWDRKNYFYPDLPKAYQISQYDLPLCFDGAFDLPAADEKGFIDIHGPVKRIGIIRAHLEEDAGKLMHEAPGGVAIDHSIADYNRAGTPLLEIVTQPDFTTADEAVLFARLLRNLCRFLGATEGDMQKGHMRFEPNINCELTLADGRLVRTPVVEVKNLNSFRSLRGAIAHELAEQPRRWADEGLEMGPGMKMTRGWDDVRGVTFPQRGKEDAHDYRYFPDPDLPPVVMDPAWRESVRAGLVEPPLARMKRAIAEYDLAAKEAQALTEDRDACFFHEAATARLTSMGIAGARAGKLAANLVLGPAMKRANERGVGVHELGITPEQAAGLAGLRESGSLSNQTAEALFDLLCEPANRGRDAADLASERGLLTVRDDAALAAWVDEAIAQNPQAASDVRTGKQQAIGRLVGAVMKLAGGKADAAGVREALLRKLSS